MKKQLKFLFLIAVIFLLSLTIISCDLLKEITAEQYTKEETEKGKEKNMSGKAPAENMNDPDSRTALTIVAGPESRSGLQGKNRPAG